MLIAFHIFIDLIKPNLLQFLIASLSYNYSIKWFLIYVNPTKIHIYYNHKFLYDVAVAVAVSSKIIRLFMINSLLFLIVR